MLRAMRGAAETWIIKVLMVFLVISFSIWGVGDIFRGNPQQRTVACIGGIYVPLNFLFGSTASVCTGERISVQDLQLDFRRAFEQEQQRRGIDYTMDKAKQQGLLDRVLRESAARKLFNHVAKDFGLRYDANAVITQLTLSPDLQTKDGKFDKDKLTQVIKNMHMSDDEFVHYMADTFAQQQSIGLFSGMAGAPAVLEGEFLKAQGQERLLQVLRLPHSKMPIPAAPDKTVLEKFYQENPALFSMEEFRSVSILKIMLDDMLPSVGVSDSEVAAAFEKRKAEFAHGEQRDILQVVLSDSQAAKALADAAQAGHDLRKAAEAIKKDVVLLENQTEETIPHELYTTVFTSDPGTISEPIKTDFGYHIVQIVKVTPPYDPTLNDVSDKLRSKLQREKAQEALQELANKVDDEINAGKSLEDISKSYNLPLITPEPFNTRAETAKHDKLNLPSTGIVIQNAFGLNEGENSAMLDDHMGNFLVVHLTKLIPAHVRPYDDVASDVLTAWQKNQQKLQAQTEAEKIMAEWQQKPQAFTELAKRAPLSGSDKEAVSELSGYIGGLPKLLQRNIMDLTPGNIIVGDDDDMHYIVRLTGYRAFSPDKNNGAQASLKSLIQQGWRGDILDQFETMLRQKYPVSINHTILSELRHVDNVKDE